MLLPLFVTGWLHFRHRKMTENGWKRNKAFVLMVLRTSKGKAGPSTKDEGFV